LGKPRFLANVWFVAKICQYFTFNLLNPWQVFLPNYWLPNLFGLEILEANQALFGSNPH
jgi:hypothetical protein